MTGLLSPASRHETIEFVAIEGWKSADHAAALRVYERSAGWAGLPCPPTNVDARDWFQAKFQPLLLTESTHFTAYYEPEIPAALRPDSRYVQPVYRLPDGTFVHHDRREIDAGSLAGLGLEIAWVEQSVDAFLMQVQGCGRLRFADGSLLRLGYAGQNGHAYRSVGQEMVRRGFVLEAKVSANSIRDFCLTNPVAGLELLQHNRSYVFFKPMPNLCDDDGPIGNVGVSLTANLSLAVDPEHVPLGLPVWPETSSPTFRHQGLMIAQDIGGAIKGSGRADLFLGSGSLAGEAAGRVNQTGTMIVFWPRSGL